MPRLSKTLFALFPLVVSGVLPLIQSASGSPGKVYGVNLGSWLVLEPWMLPQEWLDMGGESCADCSTCIASEFAFAEAYPDTVDETFDKHWSTWFAQEDVDKLSSYGINTVRIPLGYWIVEPLVDRATEFYPRGGIKQLKRGLRQLKAAGISAILDHHAPPGVQTAGQMFAGRCTNDVQFYTDYNYHRALVWTAVMTAMSHIDPDFGSVYSIEAVNEPIMDATKTPGYGEFQKNFVKVVRAVETLLGVKTLSKRSSDGLLDGLFTTVNVTASLLGGGETYEGEVGQVLADAAPMVAQIAIECGVGSLLGEGALPSRKPLTTMFMDVNWQYNNPANPADAADGPQVYDNHLYYSFGGVADANPDAYLASICNLQRVEDDAALGNSPLVFGEWSLATNFNTTTDFRRKWADAQKRAYSMGAGWLHWSFKTEKSELAGDTPDSWSYFEGIDKEFFTRDPSKLFDEHVCDEYIIKPNATSSSTTLATSAT